MQLRKEAWKKFRTSTGFEPVTSRLPVRCSTNRAMKPLTLGAGQVLKFFHPFLRNCINCVHCDDHLFILISFPQFIYDLFHRSLTKKVSLCIVLLKRRESRCLCSISPTALHEKNTLLCSRM